MQQVKDDLPLYVFRSNKQLFMGVFYDTMSSPCLEIVKETYEQMDDVPITSATEKIVPCMHTDSSQVKSVSVFDYIEYLFTWTELY